MPRQDADRNLLFGILALQMDFITRDALIAAMANWVMEKHRAIGDILVEKGALDPIDRAALDPMIARHLARHGGDPAASLAALSSIDTAASALRQSIADPEVFESLAFVPPSWANDPHATQAPEPSAPLPPGVRYTKVRGHAKGGLGVVFIARDAELNREVALKEIQDRHADDPTSQARFLLEAEITGGLEHPGIVPVYGLGAYEDGRPFYAMRFIRGDSLKDAITRFHADQTLKSDPGARTLELQKLLRRFLDVCNAIEYAHSRGVLHRDLKPDNVMIGRYGETLVVDWGLAKSVGRPEGDWPEAPLTPSSASGTAETLPGAVIGTPAYMSPEQAEGRFDLLGPASDVYSLGATLYSLLTGRTPVSEKNLAEVLTIVCEGRFTRPREHARWLDPALEAVCVKAMALRPVNRYSSPSALARDIERWIADEPVTAHREPFARRARRWARKHRTAVTTAVASATVAAAIIGVVTWSTIARQRRADAVGLATLADAERLEIEARATSDLARWTEAVAEARRAEAQIESGGGTTAARAKAVAKLAALQAEEGRRLEEVRAERRDQQMVRDLDEARLLKAMLKDGHFDFEAQNAAFAGAFRSYEIDVVSLPPDEAATRVRSSRIAGRLIASLDEWARQPSGVTQERLGSIARAADPGPEATVIRDAIARRDAATLHRFVGSEEARRKLGDKARIVLSTLADLDPASSLALFEAARRERPADFWLNIELASAYAEVQPPRYEASIRYYTAAVALRPTSPGAHFNLGIVLARKGEADAAIAEYREAVRLEPDFAGARNNLGAALFDRGETDAAIAEYREAVRLKPDFADPHDNLGSALARKGEADAAIAEYREATRLAITKSNKAYLPHYNLGIVLARKGEADAAIAEYREAVRLKPDVPVLHCGLGQALKGRGQFTEALKSLERGHAIGSQRPDWRLPSDQWVLECRRLVRLESKLPAILKGEAEPNDADERLALAGFFYEQKLLWISARFYGEAFAERTGLADDLATGSRYNAACAAALAGSGMGKDDPAPDDVARARLREQARDWLRTDLAAWSKVLDGGKAEVIQTVVKTLDHWKDDADLAGIRDEASLAKLPQGERDGFRSLWADVEALRRRAGGAK